MDSIYAQATEAKDRVLGTGSSQSGTEPLNAQQGKGTTDSPYDQGNAPEQPVGQGIEPPNAQQGKGTVDSAYDQGNQPENPPTTDTTTNPAVSQPAQPSASTINAAPTSAPKPKTSGIPIDLYKPAPGQDIVSDEVRGRAEALSTPKSSGIPIEPYKPAPGQDMVSDKPRGRAETPPAPKSSGPLPGSGHFDPARRDAGKKLERSVSPGQLDDGTHVRTSGDKGQSYEPGSGKMGKLKNKFHFGQH